MCSRVDCARPDGRKQQLSVVDVINKKCWLPILIAPHTLNYDGDMMCLTASLNRDLSSMKKCVKYFREF